MQHDAPKAAVLVARIEMDEGQLSEPVREMLEELLDADETRDLFLSLRASGSTVLEAIETVLRFDRG